MAPSLSEANHYYHGLPSNPFLVARSGTTPWTVPSGKCFPLPKELRPVGSHALLDIWENNLALKLKVHDLLNARKVEWRSTDIVRVGYAGDSESPAPVVLWIAVAPASLCGNDGEVVARECFQLLQENNITDVEVDIIEAPPNADDTSKAPGKQEAGQYYYYLPSHPVLVARTGAPYKVPTGPEAYSRIRELRPVGRHALRDIWEDNLALKVIAVLDARKVQWTSIDVVRIGYPEVHFAPVVLWIGVLPASLSGNDGAAVAHECRQILEENNITDVEVELRESIVIRSSAAVGPKLLEPRNSLDHINDAYEPLTPSLGLPICAESTPQVEGTGGFFIYDGENTERLFLVTARHVVFPDEDRNERFQHTDENQLHHTVRLFGDAAFEKYLKSIPQDIEGQEAMRDDFKQRLESMAKMDNRAKIENFEHQLERCCEETQYNLRKAKEAIEMLTAFDEEVKTDWVATESRVLGHVVLSPPLSTSGAYTEDWALIAVDASKVDSTNFKGNYIDLGTRISVSDFIRLINPNRRNERESGTRSFEYPYDRLLYLRGTIPDADMRRPPPEKVDERGEPCLMVTKRGSTTELTVGAANEIPSYARVRGGDGHGSAATAPAKGWVKEWAILPQNGNIQRRCAFSGIGDSGAVVVDGSGRIGGLLTGGTGSMRGPDFEIDISYATPISFLLDCMRKQGLAPVLVEAPPKTW